MLAGLLEICLRYRVCSISIHLVLIILGVAGEGDYAQFYGCGSTFVHLDSYRRILVCLNGFGKRRLFQFYVSWNSLV